MSELKDYYEKNKNVIRLIDIAADLDISEMHLRNVLKGEHMSTKMKRKVNNYLAQKLHKVETTLPAQVETKKVISKKVISQKIVFNYNTGQWENFSDVYFNVLLNSYGEVNIENELNKMSAWLMSNKNKRKSNFERFINIWLSKCQDKNTLPQRTQMLSFKQQASQNRLKRAQQKFNELTEKEKKEKENEKRKSLLENNN